LDDNIAPEFGDLEAKIGYAFKDKSLLRKALTHSSYANEANQREQDKNNEPGKKAAQAVGPIAHNETLEFLGDSILGYVIAELLFKTRPSENEGKLSKRRAAIVCEPALAACAQELGLDAHMRLGQNLRRDWGRKQAAILSDAMEAVFAAAYLDGGINAARGVIKRCLKKAINETLKYDKIIDHKSRLQEYFFGVDKDVRIEYAVTAQSGPAHRRRFVSQVRVNGRVLGEGEGGAKKESEQNAAKEALDSLCI